MPILYSPPPKIYSQPQSPQRINYNNPLALGMIAAGWPKSRLYVTQNATPIVSGRDARNLGVQAWEAQSVSAANQPTFSMPSTTSAEWTIIADFGRVVSQNYQAGVILLSPTGSQSHVMFVESGFKANGWLGSQGGGTFGLNMESTISPLTGFSQLAVTISGAAQTGKLYGNGREIGSNVGTITNTPATVSQARLFRRTDSYPNPAANGTQCSFFGVWARALTQKEIASVNENPYQLLSVPSKYLIYPGETPATTIYEFQSFSRGVGRGIARGIA